MVSSAVAGERSHAGAILQRLQLSKRQAVFRSAVLQSTKSANDCAVDHLYAHFFSDAMAISSATMAISGPGCVLHSDGSERGL